MKGENDMERVIYMNDNPFEVADTDPTPLGELLSKEIRFAYKWNDYYMFKIETDDNYDNSVYIIDKNTKKVEWGYYTSIGLEFEELGSQITPEELREALS